MNALAIAVDFIKQREGCRLTAYQDGGGKWTIGYGATGPDIKQGTTWTLQQAEDRLERDLASAQNDVRKLVSAPLSPQQEAALISFVFNLGGYALGTSTLRILANQKDFIGAAQQFPRWDRVDGREDKGVLRRRFLEAALFLEGTN